MPKVSVLVPIFNVEKYLEECLDSIINQTLQDIEIICINDGSTDDSLKIIKRYAKKDPRIVIINKQNSGYGDSMNKGLKKATGEYVAIVESDDWIEPAAFEDLLKLAKDNDAQVVKANFYNYFTDPAKANISGSVNEIVDAYETNRIIDTTTSNSIMWKQPSIWSALYRADFLKEHDITFLPSPGASYQDIGFNFKVWMNATRVVFTQEAYLHYRQDNEASSINSPGKVFCVADEHKELARYLKSAKKYDEFKDILFAIRWTNYRWNIERLTPDLAKDFILFASKEYRGLYKNGDFTFARCDANAARQIRELINDPQMVNQRKQAQAEAKVSIIIPAYNVESYIERCLNAVLDQTEPAIEVVLVDDGSTDDTSGILEEFYYSDPRFRLVSKYNQGLAAARNTGIDHASADYLMFCDSDDFYEPTSVETLLRTIQASGADIAAGSARVIYESRQLTALDKEGDRQYYSLHLQGTHPTTPDVLKLIDVSSWNKIFRRKIIDQHDIRYPEGLYYEDAYFFYAYAWSSDRISFARPGTPVYNYVRRDNSIMSETFKKNPRAYDHTEISFRLFHFLLKEGTLPQHAEEFRDIFNSNLDFSLRYLPEGSLGFLLDRLESFERSNRDAIRSVDQGLQKTIQERIELLRRDIASQMVPLHTQPTSARSYIKRAAKHILPKISPSYRMQQRALDELRWLQRKLEKIEAHQVEFEKSARRRIASLERILSRQNKEK